MFTQRRERMSQVERIELRYGRLGVKSLAFAAPEDFRPVEVVVKSEGVPVKCSFSLGDGKVMVALEKKLFFFEGQKLDVVISPGPGTPRR